MKAQAFLTLVSEMLTAQQDYFKARRQGRLDTHNMLVKARDLEKKVMTVVDEGRLEEDDPMPVQVSLWGSAGNLCQIIDHGQRCTHPAVKTVLARNEFDHPCSIRMCVSHLQDVEQPQGDIDGKSN